MDHLPEIAERSAVCPQHGEYMSLQLVKTVRGGIWSQCQVCAQEQAEARAEEERKAVKAAADRRISEAIGATHVPSRFIGRTFDNFRAETDAQRHALTVARDYFEQFAHYAKRGTGLIFSGLPGTGKSHLAGAILHGLALDWHVRYRTCLDLIRIIRDTWRKGSERSESEVLARLEAIDLLVIDEVGVQYGTDGEQTVLFEVIDRRYREVKPTIFLTNQDKAGFKQFVGERSFDRLAETCRWVPFDWASYRPTARKEG